jgi:hypothetical protein
MKKVTLFLGMLGMLLFSTPIFTKELISKDIDILQSVPSNVAVGSSFVVELRITKTNISGVAKFQQELPAGFTATAIETATGSFLFENNTVKIIWMNLPEETEFKISYRVNVPKNSKVNSTVSLGGKISYVENSEKLTKDVAPASVLIIKGEIK